ncbi:DMT family transporter [Xylophilus sp. GOD-11R]|uniref:DMT family transporter n=1 Tax=Xylophilus sp. GOD-11R TaxID=3089814 RepID=UPI00298C4A70|nr:DMT family transporter [Xylophilus sp. GOD-11R]WPB55743.1 DMT family transporter [Xylophilus sp. GOD-11R]
MSPALAGIACAVLATACFATLDSSMKYMGATLPLFTVVWIRYAVQAVVVSAAILPSRGLAALRTEHPRFQCLRGVLLMSTSILGFFSLRHMPVGEFTAVVMVTPLAITVLAGMVLHEKVSALRWMLVALGFAGTLVVLRPGSEAFQWATLLPLALVGCNAWFQVLTSKLARTEDPITMQFYSGWVGTALLSLMLPLGWKMPGDWLTWVKLIAMGLAGTVGHYLLTIAYRRAPAATLMPFFYAQIGFAVVAGYLLFSHVPDSVAVAGIVLIALSSAAGAWLTVRESRIVVQPAEA